MMTARAIIIGYNKISHLEHGDQTPRPTEILVPLVVLPRRWTERWHP